MKIKLKIMKQNMQQRKPRTVEQQGFCIRQNWDNIPLPDVQQPVSSVPGCLWAAVRREDVTQW